MASPENKAQLLTDIELQELVSALDEDYREFYEERAAIFEFEAGYSRPEAERLAWDETVRRKIRLNG